MNYGNDYRCLTGIGFNYDGALKYLWKYHQYDPYNSNPAQKMPMLRMTESYYIAAECLKSSDPARAAELLNYVRAARNLEEYPLPATLSPEDLQDEIGKEYRKEFLGEGEMFYYYKRLNASRIEGAAVNAGDNVYVLPMPDNEIEFGGRE
jgi:hypothetical protein